MPTLALFSPPLRGFVVMLFFFLGISLGSYAQSGDEPDARMAKTLNRWVLYKTEGGVQFYIRNSESSFDGRYNTLIRLRNTNSYEVTVSFLPKFPCEGGGVYAASPVRVHIYASHSVTLLAYRPCRGEMPLRALFETLKIKQR